MTLDTRPQVDTAPQTLTPEAQKVKDAMRDTTATGLENTRIANQTRALVEEVARTQEQRDAEAILASEFGILKGGEPQNQVVKGEVNIGNVDGTQAGGTPLDVGKILDKAQNTPVKQAKVTVDKSVHQDIAKAQAQMKEKLGNAPVNIGFNAEKLFNSFPKGIQDFFISLTKFFARFTESFASPEAKKGLSKILKDPKQLENSQKILDKFSVKMADGKDKATELQFKEGTKIKGERLKKQETANSTAATTPATTPQSEVFKIEGGKIVVLDGSQIKEIKEDKGDLILAIENKDGSTDTYTVSDATVPVQAPTAVA